MRSVSLGQGAVLDQKCFAFTNVFYSLSFAQKSVIEFKIQIVINFNFQCISFV
jgi:hypothetical protein